MGHWSSHEGSKLVDISSRAACSSCRLRSGREIRAPKSGPCHEAQGDNGTSWRGLLQPTLTNCHPVPKKHFVAKSRICKFANMDHHPAWGSFTFKCNIGNIRSEQFAMRHHQIEKRKNAIYMVIQGPSKLQFACGGGL